MKNFCIFLLLVLSVSRPSHTQSQLIWQSLDGPKNSDVETVALAPDGDIYIVVRNSNDIDRYVIQRSSDDGATWEHLYEIESDPIYTVAVADDGTLYLGTHSGIRRSTNKGVTWQTKTGGFGLIHKFLFGDNGFIVAAGYYNGNYFNSAFSNDNGVSWVTLLPPVLQDNFILDLAVTPTGTIFAATYYDGLYRSKDKGNTWESIGDSTMASSWFVFSNGEERVSTLAYWSMVVSSDTGNTWSDPGEELGIVTSCIQIHDSLYLASRDQDSVFLSTPHGKQWNPFWISPIPGNEIQALSVDGQDRVYIATRMGLYRIPLAGGAPEHLFFMQGDLLPITHLFVPDQNSIIASSDNYGPYRIESAGGNWSLFDTPASVHQPVHFIGSDAQNTLYTVDNYSVYRKPASGSWETVFSTIAWRFAGNIALTPDGIFFAAIYQYTDSSIVCGLSRSTDGGLTWTALTKPDSLVNALVYDTAHTTLFLSTESALYASTDLGTTWEKRSSVRAEVIACMSDGTLYISGNDGMYVSSDGGQVWTALPFVHANQVVAIVKNSRGDLFTALDGSVPISNNGGVWASLDGGATWAEELQGLPSSNGNTRCYDMILDSQERLVLAAETGVYRTSVPVSIREPQSAPVVSAASVSPHPVPYGAAAHLRYTLDHQANVSISIYSISGEKVMDSHPGIQYAGKQSGTIPTQGMKPGLYLYCVSTASTRFKGAFIIQ